MKKAKVILTALTVFAVVGGALAFKAKSQNFCYYTLNSSQVCSLAATIEDFTEDPSGVPAKIVDFTGTPCAATQANCNQKILTITTD